MPQTGSRALVATAIAPSLPPASAPCYFPLHPMATRLQAHPWHGIPVGADAPAVVNAFIEIVPTDTVKYEIDKASGHLKLDRPQQLSNVCPAPYGFVPQTWCHERVAALAMARTQHTAIVGD